MHRTALLPKVHRCRHPYSISANAEAASAVPATCQRLTKLIVAPSGVPVCGDSGSMVPWNSPAGGSPSVSSGLGGGGSVGGGAGPSSSGGGGGSVGGGAGLSSSGGGGGSVGGGSIGGGAGASSSGAGGGGMGPGGGGSVGAGSGGAGSTCCKERRPPAGKIGGCSRGGFCLACTRRAHKS